ncbi:MAG: hypothetical protein RLY31_937 [Bacteroidota bacterium]
MLCNFFAFYYQDFTPRFAGRDCGAGQLLYGQASRFTAGLLRLGDLTRMVQQLGCKEAA